MTYSVIVFKPLKREISVITGETRKNLIVENLDYQIPLTQLMGPKENGNMQAAKRD